MRVWRPDCEIVASDTDNKARIQNDPAKNESCLACISLILGGLGGSEERGDAFGGKVLNNGGSK